MKIVIEFYRTRSEDDAHALVGRETDEAADIADAIEIAQRLAQTLAMPQRPDAITISDADGKPLFSWTIAASAHQQGRPAHDTH